MRTRACTRMTAQMTRPALGNRPGRCLRQPRSSAAILVRGARTRRPSRERGMRKVKTGRRVTPARAPAYGGLPDPSHGITPRLAPSCAPAARRLPQLPAASDRRREKRGSEGERERGREGERERGREGERARLTPSCIGQRKRKEREEREGGREGGRVRERGSEGERERGRERKRERGREGEGRG